MNLDTTYPTETTEHVAEGPAIHSTSGSKPGIWSPQAGVLSSTGVSLQQAEGGFGFQNYGLRLEVDAVEHIIDHFEPVAANAPWEMTAVPAPGCVLTARLCPLDRSRQYTLHLSLHNQSRAPVHLGAAAFGQFGADAKFYPGEGHVLGWGLRYAHTGNLRTERYPFCAADYPYVRQLPVERRILGDTEDQPFPALFIRNEATQGGVVIAMTSQQRAAPVFEMLRQPLFRPDVFETFRVHWDFPQSRGPLIAPGETLALETLYLQMTEGVGADYAFEDYLDFLQGENDFRGANTVLRNEALHCTWNYGVFDDQRAESLLETARCISREFPKIKFFLIDDGYLKHNPSRGFLNRFYPDPEQDLSTETWPEGMRGFTDELRRLGLRPGLWWTPTVRLPCRLYDEHPDWFLREADGSLYLIGGENAYLDYSHPEALAFLDRTLAVILGKWGMDACKIDFYSQNFESRRPRLQDAHRTGIETRRDFFETVRRHLPEDGVILSCIAMGMGNPFLAELVDTYRCSMDISDGSWQDQVNGCLWTLPMLGFGGRRSALLNTDSAGINLSLPENENMFRLTWCYITMGILETGGRFETLPEKYLRAMQRIVDRCDQGYPCRCPDLDAYTGVPLPQTLFVTFPPHSPTAQMGIRQSVAFFNWTDSARAVSVERRWLGHQGDAVQVEDFWSGEAGVWEREFVTIELAPRSARLFDVFR